LIHAEDFELSQNGQMNEGEMSTLLGMKGIPHLAEYSRVKRDLDLLAHYGGRLHFSHISTPESLDMIRKAKKSGLQVSCDMAVHHLILSDDLLHDYDSNYKVNPPLREASVIKKFWKAIEDGTVDAIVSDHNPKDEESKNLEFDLADDGIIGLETLFPALFTHGKSKVSLDQMIDKLTDGPDGVLGRKRAPFAEGVAADFTLFSTESEWQYDIADGEAFNSPFLGETFEARIIAVINKEYVFINS
jgi:dihydroorotase